MKYLAPLVIVCTTLALTGCTDHAANASQYIHSYIGNPGNADALRVDGRWVLYSALSVLYDLSDTNRGTFDVIGRDSCCYEQLK